jgi:hypothetical protein
MKNFYNRSVRKFLYRNVYLKTPYWKWMRRRVAKRAEYRCQVKGCTRIGANLDAHHTTYRVLGMEWLFPRAMVYLCRNHHNDTHRGFALWLKNGHRLIPFAMK